MEVNSLKMLSLNNRLKKTTDIRKVFKSGRFFKEGFLILKTAKNNLNKSRFGFVVSQKVSKKAVVRNKIKRRMRGIMRKELKEIKTGTDNLFMALPGLEKKDFSTIQEAISSLLKKAKLLSHD